MTINEGKQDPVPPPRVFPLEVFGWVLVVLTIATIIVGVMLAPEQLSWMRVHWLLFNWPMLRIERLETIVPLNIQHVLMFGWLSFLLRLTWRNASWKQLFAVVAGLAIGTELLQVWLPGRDPRLSDVRDDLLGACLAWVLLTLLVGLRRKFATKRT